MYIPVLKNRLFENKLLREQCTYFDDTIMPLIEVLNQKIGRTTMQVDELLSVYDSHINSPYFIDFFTFDEGEYTNFDLNQVPFYIAHRNDTINDYRNLLALVCNTKHGIPVISIKKGREFLLNRASIKSLIRDLQSLTSKIAVRIQSLLLQSYFFEIDTSLRENDLLIYDINEESIQSKVFDRKQLSNRAGSYKVVLLHSPRSSKLNNGSYLDGDYSGLIDNSIKNDYKNLGFDGFADYAGLKNVLPTDGGNGKGAALGLFYDNTNNQFFSIMNPDIDQGTRGHLYVLDQAFKIYKNKLDPLDNCPAFKYMYSNLYSQGKPGQWGQWKYITVLRYISQIKHCP